MDIKMLIGICLLIIVGMFFLFKRWYEKKSEDILEELRLFKKEKEYASEAMMIFSETYSVIFANESAKSLFSLDDNYHPMPQATRIKLKIDTSDPVDFFELIRREVEQREENFHLQNVLLVSLGKMRQVNVYVDQSGWNINKTISCVIDMQAISTADSLPIESDGEKDFFTDLPSQFTALKEINTLVIEMHKKAESFTLILLGIDHFSDLQTTLGLNFSNKIIKGMSETLKEFEEELELYRMDCDKFLLIPKETKTEEEIHFLAKKIIGQLQRKSEKNVHLTMSAGIASYPMHGENASKLIDHVYIALDEAQKKGESSISFFTTEVQSIHKDELKMNEEIQEGLKNHEFLLHYQPIFNLKTEEMVGVEALVRWQHPELGLITAEKFIDVAKRTGLILDIGEYVFDEAIKQRKNWDKAGLQSFKITLNLSLKEMQVERFVKQLESLFDKHDMNPKYFNLDITEKSAMTNIEKTALDFKLFKDLGLSMSLDHFGESTSSIKHLQALPLSMIKIDRSLIFDLSSNINHQETVKSMIALAHTLGYEVVAEGVETSKESALLYDFGCDHAQGYLFAKPLPVNELEEILR